jgi:hypothetical protein
VAPLGTKSEDFSIDETDEPQSLVPFGHLADEEMDDGPTRQLLITKGQPHRGQIGRLVERLNALAAKRAFALRNWATIQNAGIHISHIGEELDGVLSAWSIERNKLSAQYDQSTDKNQQNWMKKWLQGTLELQDQHVDKLTALINKTETRLVRIGASLDTGVGQGGSGQLLFAINRSRMAIDDYTRLLRTLKTTNIDTWVTYDQYTDRGLAPVFNAIERTGTRLASLRERLHSITAMIQTSALYAQAAATAKNTTILRRVAASAMALPLGLATYLLQWQIDNYDPEQVKSWIDWLHPTVAEWVLWTDLTFIRSVMFLLFILVSIYVAGAYLRLALSKVAQLIDASRRN